MRPTCLIAAYLLGGACACAGASPSVETEPDRSPAIDRVLVEEHVTCVLVGGVLYCNGMPPLSVEQDAELGGFRAFPVSGVTDLACTYLHCCLGREGGNVSCWGRGYPTVFNGPPFVRFDEAVDAVGTGAQRACALLRSGQLGCWSVPPAAPAVPPTHVEVSTPHGLREATQLAWSGEGACVLEREGAVMCWATRAGNGAGGAGSVPMQAYLPSSATMVVASETHTCAIVAGAGYCWGHDEHGELGDGSARFHEPGMADMPERVALEAPLQAIAPGDLFTCALDSSGRVWCWGLNDRGQLGDGTRSPHVTPTRVARFAGATGIVAGREHACVWTRDEVWCWGARRFPVRERNAAGCEEDACTTPVLAAHIRDLLDD